MKRNIISRKELENKYKEFISTHEDNEVYTYGYCTDYGLGLADSTIDKIELMADGRIAFYYNENTGDFDYIDEFDTDELVEFLEGLKIAIEDEALEEDCEP